MACTEEILSQLYAAQLNIAMGKNVVSIVIDGEETEFGPGNPAMLSALIDDCESELGVSTEFSSVKISTSKGFGI